MSDARQLIAEKVRPSLPLDAYRDSTATALAADLVDLLLAGAEAVVLTRDGTVTPVERNVVGSFHHGDWRVVSQPGGEDR